MRQVRNVEVALTSKNPLHFAGSASAVICGGHRAGTILCLPALSVRLISALMPEAVRGDLTHRMTREGAMRPWMTRESARRNENRHHAGNS
jgi:hypothetical protein